MENNDVDPSRRRFLLAATTVVGGVGSAFAAWPFVASMQPSVRAQALGAPVQIDISKLEPGQRVVREWRGKPVWVVRRTPEALAALATLEGKLSDPKSDMPQQPGYAKTPTRATKPEYLVLEGLCTHLGCSPLFRPELAPAPWDDQWKGGFYCPCHGSRFDLAGRVYSGSPAPSNIVVPPHRYLSDTMIEIGIDQEKA